MARRLMPRRPGRRVLAGLLLVVVVAAAHWNLGRSLADRLDDWRHAPAPPPRLQAVFVRELLPSAPPPVVALPAAAPPAVRARRAAAPARPASAVQAEAASEPASVVAAADPASSASAPSDEPLREAAVEPAEPASAPLAAAAPAPAAASSPEAPAFEWPASTRLSYVLTGNYRGEVHGSAQVEWIRAGERYQVHLDVTVGPGFAPLMARSMTSDGLLRADGLYPQRYDEETRRAFSDPRRASVRLEDDAVILADGQRRERWAGVQDTASQFVQLTWMFTVSPALLQVGRSIDMPLALPRSVDRWTFDVLETQTLHPPFGPIETFHLKPRRVARPGGDLTAEVWIAPALEYLPVRIRIHQDAETYIDLMIERPPLQALGAPR